MIVATSREQNTVTDTLTANFASRPLTGLCSLKSLAIAFSSPTSRFANTERLSRKSVSRPESHSHVTTARPTFSTTEYKGDHFPRSRSRISKNRGSDGGKRRS